jgi:hypothetical protein
MAATNRLSTGITMTWNAASVLKIVDVNCDLDMNPQDATTQIGFGSTASTYRSFIAGISKDEFTLTCQWDEADTVNTAFLTDAIAGTKRAAVFVLPGSITYTLASVLIGKIAHKNELGSIITADIQFLSCAGIVQT